MIYVEWQTRTIQVATVTFGTPPWLGGDAAVHLHYLDTELFRSEGRTLKGCGTRYDRATAHTFIRGMSDITCDGCAAQAVAVFMSDNE